jgi:hypothetical protein
MDDTDRNQARDRLAQLCSRTPCGYSDWSWNRSFDFKQEVASARGLLSRPRTSVQKLTAQANKLEGFFNGTQGGA